MKKFHDIPHSIEIRPKLDNMTSDATGLFYWTISFDGVIAASTAKEDNQYFVTQQQAFDDAIAFVKQNKREHQSERLKEYYQSPEYFNRLAIKGFASSGSAINDVVWFNVGEYPFGIVLLCSPEFEWRAYIGVFPLVTTEDESARAIAAHGAKVPLEWAIALFPSRFPPEKYKFNSVLPGVRK